MIHLINIPFIQPAFVEVNGDSLTSRFGYYGNSQVDLYIQELTGMS